MNPARDPVPPSGAAGDEQATPVSGSTSAERAVAAYEASSAPPDVDAAWHVPAPQPLTQGGYYVISVCGPGCPVRFRSPGFVILGAFVTSEDTPEAMEAQHKAAVAHARSVAARMDPVTGKKRMEVTVVKAGSMVQLCTTAARYNHPQLVESKARHAAAAQMAFLEEQKRAMMLRMQREVSSSEAMENLQPSGDLLHTRRLHATREMVGADVPEEELPQHTSKVMSKHAATFAVDEGAAGDAGGGAAGGAATTGGKGEKPPVHLSALHDDDTPPGQKYAAIAWLEDRCGTDYALERFQVLRLIQKTTAELDVTMEKGGLKRAVQMFLSMCNKTLTHKMTEEEVTRVTTVVFTAARAAAAARKTGKDALTPGVVREIAEALHLPGDKRERLAFVRDARASVRQEVTVCFMPFVFKDEDDAAEGMLTARKQWTASELQVVKVGTWIVPTERPSEPPRVVTMTAEKQPLLDKLALDRKRVATLHKARSDLGMDDLTQRPADAAPEVHPADLQRKAAKAKAMAAGLPEFGAVSAEEALRAVEKGALKPTSSCTEEVAGRRERVYRLDLPNGQTLVRRVRANGEESSEVVGPAAQRVGGHAAATSEGGASEGKGVAVSEVLEALEGDFM